MITKKVVCIPCSGRGYIDTWCFNCEGKRFIEDGDGEREVCYICKDEPHAESCDLCDGVGYTMYQAVN